MFLPTLYQAVLSRVPLGTLDLERTWAGEGELPVKSPWRGSLGAVPKELV